MRKSDLEYFRRRAVQERTMAVSAMSDDAAAVHTELAKRYEELIGEGRPTLHLVHPRSAAHIRQL